MAKLKFKSEDEKKDEPASVKPIEQSTERPIDPIPQKSILKEKPFYKRRAWMDSLREFSDGRFLPVGALDGMLDDNRAPRPRWDGTTLGKNPRGRIGAREFPLGDVAISRIQDGRYYEQDYSYAKIGRGEIGERDLRIIEKPRFKTILNSRLAMGRYEMLHRNPYAEIYSNLRIGDKFEYVDSVACAEFMIENISFRDEPASMLRIFEITAIHYPKIEAIDGRSESRRAAEEMKMLQLSELKHAPGVDFKEFQEAILEQIGKVTSIPAWLIEPLKSIKDDKKPKT